MSWVTRSPAADVDRGRRPARLSVTPARPATPSPSPRIAPAGARRVERRSRCAASRRARPGSRRGTATPGCTAGAPQAERTAARERCSRCAGPGDADVGQPPLLLELLRVAERAHVREGAVLHPGEEDDRELQPLGGVQRHQRDDPAVEPPSSPSGIWSASATSETCSRKSSSEATSPVSARVSSNSRATATSSARFSTRVSSCGSALAAELGEVAALLDDRLEQRRRRRSRSSYDLAQRLAAAR